MTNVDMEDRTFLNVEKYIFDLWWSVCNELKVKGHLVENCWQSLNINSMN